MLFCWFPLFALCSPFLPSIALGNRIQKPHLVVPADYGRYRDVVEGMFDASYDAYRKHAFGHDSLRPLTNGFSDTRNGWGASIFDAMSTMIIMGKDVRQTPQSSMLRVLAQSSVDIFREALEFVAQTDFRSSRTQDTISVFETTIRYLGGLLSAYELTDGRYSILLDKAKEVADKMAFAWIDGNKIPYGQMDFDKNAPGSFENSNIAEAGSLTLEWFTLSKYTNNDTYRSLAEESVRHIAHQPCPLPGILSPTSLLCMSGLKAGSGLPARDIMPSSGRSVGGYVTWGGGSDSYLEYLIKYAHLSRTSDRLFEDAWRIAVDSSIKYLLKTSTPGGYAYMGDLDDSGNFRHVGSHLACFHGGNWLYGGKLLRNQTIINIALELVDGCWNTYASTETGIGPETFSFISQDGAFTGRSPPTREELDFNAAHGFYITGYSYILRPEVLESNFYAWRITGDVKYLNRAVSTVNAFRRYLGTGVVYAGLANVDDQHSPKIDDMESFWFAEVLKYLYLTFDDPSHYSLDDYVFNTEAHPFKLSSHHGRTEY